LRIKTSIPSFSLPLGLKTSAGWMAMTPIFYLIMMSVPSYNAFTVPSTFFHSVISCPFLCLVSYRSSIFSDKKIKLKIFVTGKYKPNIFSKGT
jgi:hypothetical protein